MAWNPETYNQFKSDRFRPFYDLLELVKVKPGMEVIDLGCGTGELTRKLADSLPDSTVLGIDSSEEMLRDSLAFANNRVRFEQRTIEEQVGLDGKYDLVFSNAAVQWVDDHETLFPNIISMLKPGGQLLIQMPDQHHNISNRMLNRLAEKEPFRTALQGWTRTSPVLDIDQYARILFEQRSRVMNVFEKIYPLVLQDSNALFDWVSGTALIPYTEKLDGEIRDEFISEYRRLLQEKFEKPPVFYPFKRIILEATF
ncbi:methyltransferase domain-containing protein [Dyadobacter sp. CY323]|uniref:methyltransferase domain-containing protein n=1 Tax=Dyadobacter sp. CY323 TaxID=2907302 RepID=UPI001F3B6C38|nr:methyltransferase domain-containing protein [Dyadobacter sp. CY323]MCE6992038.1 methyltransferase domain-containing protein [Dyadobacter sp. CY323]